MSIHRILTFLLIATPFILTPRSACLASEKGDTTEVVIVSALHQIHEEVDYYSFSELQRIVEKLHPTVLALELTQRDLDERRQQTVKLEYQHAIFPLLEKHPYKAVAMEPPEPLYTELVELHRASIREAMENDSLKVMAFGKYTTHLIETLKGVWTSAASANSSFTDKLFQVKHLLQDQVFGAKGAEVWHKWNMHFLKIIKEAAITERGGRIVVIVGAEHSYWLKDKLKTDVDIKLLDTEKLLSR